MLTSIIFSLRPAEGLIDRALRTFRERKEVHDFRVKSFHSTAVRKPLKFLIANSVADFLLGAFHEIAIDDVLDHTISPVNHNSPIFENQNPLAIDWHTSRHHNLPGEPEILFADIRLPKQQLVQ